jgi:hydrogenase expression/formation protein HypD
MELPKQIDALFRENSELAKSITDQIHKLAPIVSKKIGRKKLK